MQENLTDVSERLEEKAAGTEAINLVSYPSCGSKKLELRVMLQLIKVSKDYS